MIDDLALNSLVLELQTRGLALRRAGDRLFVSDPHKALTPGLSTAIKQNKPGLLAWLNTPIGLAVVSYPLEQGNYDLLMRLLSDARCLEFYAADRALCEALDREDATAIALALARFNQALAQARQLASEIIG